MAVQREPTYLNYEEHHISSNGYSEINIMQIRKSIKLSTRKKTKTMKNTVQCIERHGLDLAELWIAK